MPRRNSPQVIQHLDDLSQIDVIVVVKRSGQRASVKKNRRNRHYEKQFTRNSLARQVPLVDSDPEAQEPQHPLGEGR